MAVETNTKKMYNKTALLLRFKQTLNQCDLIHYHLGYELFNKQ